MTDPPAGPRTGIAVRVRLWWEIAIVLGLSLGSSAVYSIVTIIARYTVSTPISQQSAQLNPSRNPREWLDFTDQFLGIVFALFTVALALYLLWRPTQSAFARIGLDFSRIGRDVATGFALLVVIGIPGLGLYLAGRALGFTVNVEAAPLDTYWWTVPILVLSAFRSAVMEEVIVVGYLFTRLRQLGWSTWTMIVACALLRGSYHLYQGFGSFAGNVAMGIVFGWCYARWGRVMPLVIAHWTIDVISFVGYPLAVAWWPGLFPS